jgi:hypothetical protein
MSVRRPAYPEARSDGRLSARKEGIVVGQSCGGKGESEGDGKGCCVAFTGGRGMHGRCQRWIWNLNLEFRSCQRRHIGIMRRRSSRRSN